MDSHGFFFQAFVYLLAAVIAVPIAKRLGLGSVLGYLLAGVAIGPSVLGFIATGGGDVMHFAEFGVVMMLFLIGLELRPVLLWEMRGPILGLGGAQVLVTIAAIAALALICGLAWQIALTIGMIAAMSSTAIVLQSLNEKGLLKTPGGQACFSVLLFQDIAVIPILALLPLLTSAPVHAASHGTGLSTLPGWQQGLATLGAVAAIFFAGRFVLRHFFRFVAGTHLREIFTATALLLVLGISLLMQMVGLSPALGAFLAGVVLAESEYRHQLEADIEPFKGLLLGLFFIAVGAGLDLPLIQRQPALIALLVVALLTVKFVLLLLLGRIFKLDPPANLLFAFALAQGGEFAFVLISFAQQQSVFTAAIAGPLVAAIAVSMACAPFLFLVHDRFVAPRFERKRPQSEPDQIDEHDNPVILAGFGRFGHVIGRLLRANGFGVTVLEHDADWVETLRNFGVKTFYGDASRLDLLRLAGAEQARLFVCAVDDLSKSLEIVDLVRKHFPHLTIYARAVDRQHAYELLHHGVEHVYRETLGSSLDLSVDALRELGVSTSDAQRVARLFKDHDEAAVRDMANVPMDDESYASRARQHIENFKRVLENDRETLRPGVSTPQEKQEAS